MSGPVLGYASQLGVDSQNPVTKRFDFLSEDFVLAEVIADLNGLRGTRDRAKERTRAGTRVARGNIVMEPTAVEWSNLLQWILGGTPTGSGTVTYPIADALSAYTIQIDRVAKVYTYATAYVNRATISGRYGEPLRLEIEAVGEDESVGNAGSFPSLALDIANSPFMFFDLVLAVGGTDYQPREWSITIDNVLDTSRYLNSQTLTAIAPLDRHITTTFSLPYGDAVAVYDSGEPTGVSYVATFTNGNAVLTFTAGKIVFPRNSPNVPGRVEIFLPVHGELFKSSSTASLSVSLNVGP